MDSAGSSRSLGLAETFGRPELYSDRLQDHVQPQWSEDVKVTLRKICNLVLSHMQTPKTTAGHKRGQTFELRFVETLRTSVIKVESRCGGLTFFKFMRTGKVGRSTELLTRLGQEIKLAVKVPVSDLVTLAVNGHLKQFDDNAESTYLVHVSRRRTKADSPARELDRSHERTSLYITNTSFGVVLPNMMLHLTSRNFLLHMSFGDQVQPCSSLLTLINCSQKMSQYLKNRI